MGGKGSGRRDGNTVLAQANDARNVDPESNHAAILFGKALFELTREEVDLSDPDAVEQRFFDFLDCCDRAQLRPMMTGLAMALGIHTVQLSRIGQGDESCLSRKLTGKSRLIVKKAYDFMRLSWEINLQKERGNPVKWLFLGKNYYGMRDQTEQVVTHREEPVAALTEAQVAAKYAALVGRQEPARIEGEVVDAEVIEVEEADAGDPASD